MTLKGVWNIVCGIALVLLAGFLLFGGSVHFTLGNNHSERDSTTYVDTIPFYYPVPRDSVVVRYITKTLPVVPDNKVPESDASPDSVNADSANVILPITQKVYEDSTYRAYVSGVYPVLDSLFVFPKKIVITERKRPKRWSVGIGAGYGVSKNGISPFIGVSLQYKIFEF